MEVARQHLAVQPDGVAFEDDAGLGFELLARVHEGVPLLGIQDSGFRTRRRELGVGPWEPTQQKAFHHAAAWNATTDEPCRKDARVVEHEQIARPQVLSESGKSGVLDCAGVPGKHQETRLASLGRRSLSDQLLRQIEIKIAGS